MVAPDLVDTDLDYQSATTQTLTFHSSKEVVLTLRRKKLLEGTVEVATICKVSHMIATAMTAKMVKMWRSDFTQCSISAPTSCRQKSTALMNAENCIKHEFKQNMPEFIIVHWDGKWSSMITVVRQMIASPLLPAFHVAPSTWEMLC